VERAVILSYENQLDLNLPDLRPTVQADPFSDKPTLDEIQRRYIKYIIESTGGKISGPGGAAEVLGLKRTSLYSRMKALKIKR
jgi:transcriptional regulator of acetoin/glycerol metabolism